MSNVSAILANRANTRVALATALDAANTELQALRTQLSTLQATTARPERRWPAAKDARPARTSGWQPNAQMQAARELAMRTGTVVRVTNA